MGNGLLEIGGLATFGDQDCAANSPTSSVRSRQRTSGRPGGNAVKTDAVRTVH
ncbi:MAG: hypothetical protein WKF83_07730 [Nocardioidaceae bacterium]